MTELSVNTGVGADAASIAAKRDIKNIAKVVFDDLMTRDWPGSGLSRGYEWRDCKRADVGAARNDDGRNGILRRGGGSRPQP